jgi:hypothetical protein
MATSRIVDLEARVEEYETAIATFARLHAELVDLRDHVSVPEANPRLEAMLKLNAETLDAMKQSLTHAVAAWKVAQPANGSAHPAHRWSLISEKTPPLPP